MRRRRTGTKALSRRGQRLLHHGGRLAITNYHSIADAVSATATLSTGDVYEVERVIYYDPDIDIAVIRVSHAALKGHDTSAFAALDIADSGTGDLRAGDTVYAIGNPLGLGLAVSSGIAQRHAAGCGAVRPALRHEHRRHLRGQQRRRPAERLRSGGSRYLRRLCLRQ